MESERSCSSTSSSGSGSESGSETGGGSSSGSGSGSSSGNSSEAEEERLEPVSVLGRSLTLPQRLCESRAVFDEVVSARTWDSLEENERERLRSFLPKFTEDDAVEKERTVRALFAREIFHFSSPLDTFHANLKQGDFRPDIAKMKRYLLKARRRQQKHKIMCIQMRSYYAALLPELLVARERVLAAARSSPPGPPPRLPRVRRPRRPTHARAKLRYFEELAAIRGEVGADDQPSEDENYPEGPPQQSRRQRRHLTAMQNAVSTGVASTLGGVDAARPSSLDCLKHILAAHRARRHRREMHPELNTAGITLEDIKQRVALVNGTKKITFGGIKSESSSKLKRSSRKENNTPKTTKLPVEIKPIIKIPRGKDLEISENSEIKQAYSNISIKRECMDTDSDNSSYIDPVESPKSNKRFKISPVRPESKQEALDVKNSYRASSSIQNELKMLDTKIKQEVVESIPFTSPNSITQPIPIKLEDLDGIDMMDLPVELADCDVTSPPKLDSPSPPPPPPPRTTVPDPALREATHANFLSLVRALFPASCAHRASRRELHTRAAALMRSPIMPLNTWYSLSDDWCAELDSALEFLAGEKGPHPDDFVPYLTYIPETQMYQWIGAGRDCDAILGRLCERWLRARTSPGALATPRRTSPPPPVPPARLTEPHPPRYQIPPPGFLRRAYGVHARPFPPHPPPSLLHLYPAHFRWATTWTVRAPTAAELVEFHSQERRRYSSAARPFTYIQHGYRAVVGPAGRGPANRASHAALLTAERPRHVSFVSLVKDAVARLPNGEGTRSHIITLLKMSQYLSTFSEATLASAVSGALDRLHTVKRDPYLRYDQRTELWIYLHRHKCEEDWERGARSRGGGKGSPRAAVARNAAPSAPVTTQPHRMEMEVLKMGEESAGAGSDSDVDVDDSGPPAPPPPPLPPPARSTIRPQQPPHRAAQPPHKLLQQVRPPLHGRPQPPHRPPPPKQQSPKAPAKAQTQKTPLLPRPLPQKALPVRAQAPQRAPPPGATHRAPPVPLAAASALSATLPTASVSTVLPPRSSPLVQTSLSQKPPAPVPIKRNFTLQQHTVESAPQTAPLQAASISQGAAASGAPQPVPPLQTVPLLVAASAPTVTSASALQQHTLQTAQAKLSQATRSLLLKAPSPAASLAVSSVLCPGLVTNAQVSVGGRRGVVRVLSPATPTSGKSLLSQHAVVHRGNQALGRRRVPVSQTTAIVSSAAHVSTSAVGGPMVSGAGVGAVGTRTVQLAGGRTVQLTSNQTLHLPSGQAVQLSSGHTLQLSSLGVGSRLPSGQTMQATPGLRATAAVRTSLPSHTASKGTIQLSGQSVQLAGLTGQMQLGHSVKLASGQSLQLSGQSVQLAGQTVQLPSGQSVQLAGQTVQLPSGQTVQTLQLAGGQTIQLSNGQTVQLGQSVAAPRPLGGAAQGTVRPVASGDKQPLVAKLLTNAQGQVISVESMVGAGRTLQLANVRSPIPKQLHTAQGVGGVRVVGGLGGARVSRPLLLAHKPLHNIILQGEGGTIRATSSAGGAPSQTIVLSNLASGQASGSVPTSSAPVLKLQQVSPLQQVKLAQGLKLQQAGGVSGASGAGLAGVRGVVMDGQQLKLVGGRHVLARLLRPALPQ